VPATLSLRRGADLLPFLPARLPRFHAGDAVPGQPDWALVELLGVGGFGEVWKGVNENSAATAAFKFCLDEQTQAALRTEADLLRRLCRDGQPPGFVRLLDTSLKSDPPFLKYEYVDGGDLSGLIRDWHESGGANAERATQVLRQVAEVVAYAHRLNPPIVHRDLKPANILLERDGPGGDVVCRVADLGIGGVAAERVIARTRTNRSLPLEAPTACRGAYSPLYASPQQIKGELPDPRDDVHALGVIWWQMLTGDLATGRPAGGAWKKRLEQKGLSRARIDLLERCIEEEAEDRPPDAAALATALGAAPIQVRPPEGEVVPVLRPVLRPESPAPTDWPFSPGLIVGVVALVCVLLACVVYFFLKQPATGTTRSPSSEREKSEAKPRGETEREKQPPPDETEQPLYKATTTIDAQSSFTSVAISPDGKTVAAGSWDDAIHLYDAVTGKEAAVLRGHEKVVQAVAFSPDGKTLASASQDETVKLWDLASGKCRRTLTGHSGSVNAVAWSPDGETLASGGIDETIILWDRDSGWKLKTLKGHKAHVQAVCFSPDGKLLASGTGGNAFDWSVRLWDVASGENVATLTDHTNGIGGVAFSPDGKTLASVAYNGAQLILWDVASRQRKSTFPFPGHGVAWSPDGAMLALAQEGDDSLIRLWDMRTGREHPPLRGGSYSVYAVAFSPDGKMLAAVYKNGCLKLWTRR
jgi:WD40 repeat protein